MRTAFRTSSARRNGWEKNDSPLQVDDVIGIAEDLGLRVEWFDRDSVRDADAVHSSLNMMLRSFFEAPATIYVNRVLQDSPARLKYDLANHIGHKVLHDGDGARQPQISGGQAAGRRFAENEHLDAKDVLMAWRDFECSYFAAALLAPKAPFRQFLAKHAYAIDVGERIDLTTTLVMRRMSSVSPYRHWHYFDAYPPGNLRAVYRGNGIPLPWGNMTMLSDPCQHWAVFRMLGSRSSKPSAQISVLRNGDDKRLYCCQSIRSKDAAGNPHVLCAGIDLAPALHAQGTDPATAIDSIEASCNRNGGSGPIPAEARAQLESVAKILNIGWVADGTAKDATIICPRSTNCPRDAHCLGEPPADAGHGFDKLRAAILKK